MKYEISELQDQLQEYEEEHQNLLNKISELEAHHDLNNRDISVSNPTPIKKTTKNPSPVKPAPHPPVETPVSLDSKSQIDPEEQTITPEQQILQLKKRLKKDSETRKKMQVVGKFKL